MIDPEITTPRAPEASPPEAPPLRAQDIQFLDIPFQGPREPQKELGLPQASPAPPPQPPTSASPEDPAAAEQQPLGRSSNPQLDPSKLPLTSAVERAKASPVRSGMPEPVLNPHARVVRGTKGPGCTAAVQCKLLMMPDVADASVLSCLPWHSMAACARRRA